MTVMRPSPTASVRTDVAMKARLRQRPRQAYRMSYASCSSQSHEYRAMRSVGIPGVYVPRDGMVHTVRTGVEFTVETTIGSGFGVRGSGSGFRFRVQVRGSGFRF